MQKLKHQKFFYWQKIASSWKKNLQPSHESEVVSLFTSIPLLAQFTSLAPLCGKLSHSESERSTCFASLCVAPHSDCSHRLLSLCESKRCEQSEQSKKSKNLVTNFSVKITWNTFLQRVNFFQTFFPNILSTQLNLNQRFENNLKNQLINTLPTLKQNLFSGNTGSKTSWLLPFIGFIWGQSYLVSDQTKPVWDNKTKEKNLSFFNKGIKKSPYLSTHDKNFKLSFLGIPNKKRSMAPFSIKKNSVPTSVVLRHHAPYGSLLPCSLLAPCLHCSRSDASNASKASGKLSHSESRASEQSKWKARIACFATQAKQTKRDTFDKKRERRKQSKHSPGRALPFTLWLRSEVRSKLRTGIKSTKFCSADLTNLQNLGKIQPFQVIKQNHHKIRLSVTRSQNVNKQNTKKDTTSISLLNSQFHQKILTNRLVHRSFLKNNWYIIDSFFSNSLLAPCYASLCDNEASETLASLAKQAKLSERFTKWSEQSKQSKQPLDQIYKNGSEKVVTIKFPTKISQSYDFFLFTNYLKKVKNKCYFNKTQKTFFQQNDRRKSFSQSSLKTTPIQSYEKVCFLLDSLINKIYFETGWNCLTKNSLLAPCSHRLLCVPQSVARIARETMQATHSESFPQSGANDARSEPCKQEPCKKTDFSFSPISQSEKTQMLLESHFSQRLFQPLQTSIFFKQARKFFKNPKPIELHKKVRKSKKDTKRRSATLFLLPLLLAKKQVERSCLNRSSRKALSEGSRASKGQTKLYLKGEEQANKVSNEKFLSQDLWNHSVEGQNSDSLTKIKQRFTELLFLRHLKNLNFEKISSAEVSQVSLSSHWSRLIYPPSEIHQKSNGFACSSLAPLCGKLSQSESERSTCIAREAKRARSERNKEQASQQSPCSERLLKFETPLFLLKKPFLYTGINSHKELTKFKPLFLKKKHSNIINGSTTKKLTKTFFFNQQNGCFLKNSLSNSFFYPTLSPSNSSIYETQKNQTISSPFQSTMVFNSLPNKNSSHWFNPFADSFLTCLGYEAMPTELYPMVTKQGARKTSNRHDTAKTNQIKKKTLLLRKKGSKNVRGNKFFGLTSQTPLFPIQKIISDLETKMTTSYKQYFQQITLIFEKISSKKSIKYRKQSGLPEIDLHTNHTSNNQKIYKISDKRKNEKLLRTYLSSKSPRNKTCKNERPVLTTALANNLVVFCKKLQYLLPVRKRSSPLFGPIQKERMQPLNYAKERLHRLLSHSQSKRSERGKQGATHSESALLASLALQCEHSKQSERCKRAKQVKKLSVARTKKVSQYQQNFAVNDPLFFLKNKVFSFLNNVKKQKWPKNEKQKEIFLQAEIKKKDQKKRRQKKQKKQTRRKTKRKRSYPRPILSRFSIYQKFLKIRHLHTKLTCNFPTNEPSFRFQVREIEETIRNNMGLSNVQNKLAKIPAKNFQYGFPKLSKTLPVTIQEKFLKPKLFRFYKKRGLYDRQLSSLCDTNSARSLLAPCLPRSHCFHIVKASEARKAGEAKQSDRVTQFTFFGGAQLRKVTRRAGNIGTTEIDHPIFEKLARKKNFSLTKFSLLDKKVFYQVPNEVINDLKRLSLKSYWLRSHLEPYLSRVQETLNDMKNCSKTTNLSLGLPLFFNEFLLGLQKFQSIPFSYLELTSYSLPFPTANLQDSLTSLKSPVNQVSFQKDLLTPSYFCNSKILNILFARSASQEQKTHQSILAGKRERKPQSQQVKRFTSFSSNTLATFIDDKENSNRFGGTSRQTKPSLNFFRQSVFFSKALKNFDYKNIIKERMQTEIQNMKENLTPGGQLKAHFFKAGRSKKMVKHKKNSFQKFVHRLIPNEGEIFVEKRNEKVKKLRIYWALHKTNILGFRNKNSLKHLISTYKIRGQKKANPTKKLIWKRITQMINRKFTTFNQRNLLMTKNSKVLLKFQKKQNIFHTRTHALGFSTPSQLRSKRKEKMKVLTMVHPKHLKRYKFAMRKTTNLAHHLTKSLNFWWSQQAPHFNKAIIPLWSESQTFLDFTFFSQTFVIARLLSHSESNASEARKASVPQSAMQAMQAMQTKNQSRPKKRGVVSSSDWNKQKSLISTLNFWFCCFFIHISSLISLLHIAEVRSFLKFHFLILSKLTNSYLTSIYVLTDWFTHLFFRFHTAITGQSFFRSLVNKNSTNYSKLELKVNFQNFFATSLKSFTNKKQKWAKNKNKVQQSLTKEANTICSQKIEYTFQNFYFQRKRKKFATENAGLHYFPFLSLLAPCSFHFVERFHYVSHSKQAKRARSEQGMSKKKQYERSKEQAKGKCQGKRKKTTTLFASESKPYRPSNGLKKHGVIEFKRFIYFQKNIKNLWLPQICVKIIDLSETLMISLGQLWGQSIFKFLEKPTKFMIAWLAEIFLLEWSSDILFYIPDTFDLMLGLSFQKLSRGLKGITLLIGYSFLGTIYQKRLFSLGELLSENLMKPDKDILMRQKQGVLFWGNWADILIHTADNYHINIPSLTILKDEQDLLLEKLEENSDLSSSVVLQANAKSENLNFSNGLMTMFSPLTRKVRFNQCLEKNGKSKWQRWSINQSLSYESRETDLFLDIHPPKSFQHFHIFKKSVTTSELQPVAKIVCEIYSGIFFKQISKNLLIVGSSSYAKSLIIQALAGETELKLISDNAQRYATVSRGIAVGMKLLREVFEALALHSPCLFLLEEIHLIGERRPMLIADDENAKAAESGGGNLGFEREEVHEKNQIIYQLNKHSISHYKKPYKGDFSLLIPTNHFCFELFLGGNKNRKRQLTPKSPLPLAYLEIEIEKNTEKGKSLSKQQQHKKRSSTQPLYPPSPITRLQLKVKQQITAPATSPFTVSILKEQKKLKPRKIIQEISWGGIGGSFGNDPGKTSCGATANLRLEANRDSPKFQSSIRAKVSLLADMALSNLSAKLDRITDLLVIMDSVRSQHGFVVFATTHIPFVLDPALRRPGRLDETLYLPAFPDIVQRFEILQTKFFAKKNYFTFDFMNYSPFLENLDETKIEELIHHQKLLLFTLPNTKLLSKLAFTRQVRGSIAYLPWTFACSTKSSFSSYANKFCSSKNILSNSCNNIKKEPLTFGLNCLPNLHGLLRLLPKKRIRLLSHSESKRSEKCKQGVSVASHANKTCNHSKRENYGWQHSSAQSLIFTKYISSWSGNLLTSVKDHRTLITPSLYLNESQKNKFPKKREAAFSNIRALAFFQMGKFVVNSLIFTNYETRNVKNYFSKPRQPLKIPKTTLSLVAPSLLRSLLPLVLSNKVILHGLHRSNCSLSHSESFHKVGATHSESKASDARESSFPLALLALLALQSKRSEQGVSERSTKCNASHARSKELSTQTNQRQKSAFHNVITHWPNSKKIDKRSHGTTQINANLSFKQTLENKRMINQKNIATTPITDLKERLVNLLAEKPISRPLKLSTAMHLWPEGYQIVDSQCQSLSKFSSNHQTSLEKNSASIFKNFYSPNFDLKLQIVQLLAGKIGEFFACTEIQDKSYLTHPNWKSKSPKKKRHLGKNLEGIDYLWRSASSLVLAIFQKRHLYQKNSLLFQLLDLQNYQSLKGDGIFEWTSGQALTMMSPAKCFENFKRTENDFQNKPTLKMHEKNQLHQQQQRIKELYKKRYNLLRAQLQNLSEKSNLRKTLSASPTDNKTLQRELSQQKEQNKISKTSEAFPTESEQSIITIAKANEKSKNQDLIQERREILKPSSIQSYYRNRILFRHKFYLTNLWWNGHLAEHNTEMTFSSDVDWRYLFVKNIGDIMIDFPDAQQHYNPRNRRWILQSGYWINWYALEKKSYQEIYLHFALQCFNEAYHILDENREILDSLTYYFLNKGVVPPIDLMTTFSWGQIP